MSFSFSGRVQLSKCAKNFTLPTAVQTFTQKVTVNLTYGQLLYLENALLVAKP